MTDESINNPSPSRDPQVALLVGLRSAVDAIDAAKWAGVAEHAVAWAAVGRSVRIFSRGAMPDGAVIENVRQRVSSVPTVDQRPGEIRITPLPPETRDTDGAFVAFGLEIGWLEEFVRIEAAIAGCAPHELYDFVGTHDYEAGLLGAGLMERWRNDLAARFIGDLLTGYLSADQLRILMKERHQRGLAAAPACHLGAMLLAQTTADLPLRERLIVCARRWCQNAWHTSDADADTIIQMVDQSLAVVIVPDARPAMFPAASALGAAVLRVSGGVAERLEAAFAKTRRLLWRPHTLARPGADYVRQELERLLCRQADVVQVDSPELAERLLAAYGLNPERLHYATSYNDAVALLLGPSSTSR